MSLIKAVRNDKHEKNFLRNSVKRKYHFGKQKGEAHVKLSEGYNGGWV